MKKKTLLFLFALLSALTASAATEIDGIYYNFNTSTNTATVTSGSSKYVDCVTIPETVNYNGVTYRVTSIGYNAFSYCYDLTSVTIPNSVTSIASEAFSGCSGLTSVHITDIAAWCKIQFKSNPLSYAHHLFMDGNEIKDLVIPNNVTSIGSSAFSGCSGLTSVTIGNSVISIGDYAFSGCSGLTSVTIGNSVTTIGGNAFKDCSSLTSVTIPNSVTEIGGGAFWNCKGLTSVTIPNSVTEIGDGVFSGCSGLTSVKIGSGVTSIGNSPFYNCSSLTSLTVENGNVKYDSRDNCNAIIETATNTLIFVCKNTMIPNSVTSIGERAFYGCTGLTSVTIPDNVTSIGNYAFSSCSDLTSVTIGSGLTTIGESAFYKCTSLVSVTIPNSVTIIGSSAFSDCTGLTTIDIPNSVTTIRSRAFYGCSGLTLLKIGSGVTTIGSSAFENCNYLKDVYCYAENVPSANNAFYTIYYYNLLKETTLHVPEVSVSAYQSTSPWSNFGSIVALGVEKKCATPTIKYENDEVIFSCETEDVEYVYEVKCDDAAKGSGKTISLTKTYTVTVYAIKDGYYNSDVATKEIEVGGGEAGVRGDVNLDGEIGMPDVMFIVNYILNGKFPDE